MTERSDALAKGNSFAAFARQGGLAFGSSALILLVNLISGIVIARALGATGRGELAAITVAPQLIGWIVALGCAQAVAFHQARDPSDAARLIGTWLALLAGLSGVGVLAGELLLPAVLAAQSDATYELAQLFMLTIAVALLSELAYGILLGDQDFGFYSLMRVVTPAAIALGYAAALSLGVLTVTTALIVLSTVGVVTSFIAITRAIRRHGVGRPSIRLARSTVWYGLRAHGTTVAGLTNARLDMLIIPAFLSATTVGLYSVATNLSWIVVSIAGSLAALAGPAATRQGGQRGARTVMRSLHVTLIVGVSLATAIAMSAGVAVNLLYGDGFSGSVTPLRILLPGSVLYAGATILVAGLYSRDRPFTAALTQIGGLVITVVGLWLFLVKGGILAAAVISSVSYAVIFLAAAVLYQRAAGLSWMAFVPTTRDLTAWWKGVLRAQPETG